MSRWLASSNTWFAVALAVLATMAVSAGPARTSAKTTNSCAQNFGTKTPVLLVHGFHEAPTGKNGVWTSGQPSMEEAINNNVPNVHVVAPFDYYGTANSATKWVSASTIGAALASDIRCLASTSESNGGPGRVIIVAHSMGGLAVRCALDSACVNKGNTGSPQPAAEHTQIGLLITLGTPNTGSTLAAKTVPLFNGALCKLVSGCEQFAKWVAGTSEAAAALREGSPELDPNYPKPDPDILQLLPSSVPLCAIAGKITLTATVFGLSPFDIPIGDVGDIAVPVNSALAEAPSTACSGTASGSETIDCGSVPIDHLDLWGAGSGVIHTGIPYLTCWHLTETTDPAWQAAVVAAIKPVAAALSLNACTSTALTKGLVAANPQLNGYSWKLQSSACGSGWAVAEVYTSAVGYGTAFLQQTASGWSSAGLGQVNCSVVPGPLGAPTPPHPLAVSLLRKAGICGKTTTTPVVAPGHDTPEDAVDGLVQAELAGNWTQACSYLVPSAQSACSQAAPQLPVPTGSATVVAGTISGSEALVEVTGSLCGNGIGCTSNNDPSAGMPNGQVTFTQAYAQATNNGSSSLSPVPCIEENGTWSVNYTS